MQELKWYDLSAENPPWNYQHVQAIIVAIDQYAEAALGNREFFLNRPTVSGPEGGTTCPESAKRKFAALSVRHEPQK